MRTPMSPTARLAGLATLLSLGAALPAHANLVLNPGFELDDTSAGPVSPPTDWVAGGGGDVGADNTFPAAGANEAFLGGGTLSQDLPTVPGAYTLTFALAADAFALIDPTALFTVSFGGQTVATIGSAGFQPATYQTLTYAVTATGASSTLAFDGETADNAGNWYLDTVSVDPVTVSTNVPAPGSVALTGALGLLLLTTRPARRPVRWSRAVRA